MNWRRFFRRATADAEQSQKLELYLDLTTQELIDGGMEPTAARAAARRKLGNSTQILENVYRMKTLTFFENALRHALRMIRTARLQRLGPALPRPRNRSQYGHLLRRQRRLDSPLALPRTRRARQRRQHLRHAGEAV